ncbi:MAG: SDR family NAD(P)-dependent oxidoreductase [Hyphomicrobiales bacterium]
MAKPRALIVGVGDGVSASLARALKAQGYKIILAARNIEKIAGLIAETKAEAHVCDIVKAEDVTALFDAIEGRVEVVIANPARRVRGPLTEVDPVEVKASLEITAFGSFLVGQAAAKRMLEQEMEDGKRGTILFTGASAGVKGFPQSATFAMGKFAQRGLAQSMARELHPQGVHVAWINIDGAIKSATRVEPADKPASMLDPDEIAKNYVHLINQQRSAWTDELVVRPWVEKF